MRKNLFLALGLGCLISPSWGATYYVDQSHSNARDSHPGTLESAPWRTLSRAMSVVAGDTVWIKSGVYSDCNSTILSQPALVPSNSGTADGRIAFRVFPGDEGTVRADCWVGTNSGQDYITWDGITLVDRSFRVLGSETNKAAGWVLENCDVARRTDQVGPEPGNYYAVMFNGADSPIVRNCTIHDVKWDPANSTDGSGLLLYHTNDGIFEHNEVYNVHHGLYDKNSGERNVFRYNYVHHFTYNGMYVTSFECAPGAAGTC